MVEKKQTIFSIKICATDLRVSSDQKLAVKN